MSNELENINYLELEGFIEKDGTGTNNYPDLENKPQINGVELVGNKSLDDLGIDIPTKTSELDNDSNFASIDDNSTANDKAWSASKIESEINDILPTGNANGVIANFDTDLTLSLVDCSVDVSATKIYQRGANLWNEQTEKGSLDDTTGQPTTDNSRLRSADYCAIKGGIDIFAAKSGNGNIRFFFYDENKAFLSKSGWYANNMSVSIPSGVSFFKVVLGSQYGTTYNNDIAVLYPSTITTYRAFRGNDYVVSEKGNIKTYVELNNIFADTGNIDVTYKKSIDYVVSEKEDAIIRYNDIYAFERGYVATSGGAIGYNTVRARSPLISIPENNLNNTLYFVCNAPSTTYSYKVCALYKDGVFVKNLNSSLYAESGTRVELDGTFNQFRICFSLINDTQPMTDEQVEALSITVISNVSLATTKKDTDNNTTRIEALEADDLIPDLWYKGKKCVAIGDSITYGFAPRNYERYGQQLDSYAKLASQKMGMSFVNYGIEGSTVAYHSGSNPMSERYTSMDNDADVIIFMGGANDIRKGISLGVMSDRTNTTFYGALHVLLGGLYKKYMIDLGLEVGKTKKIVICTPIKLLQSSAEEQGGTGTLVAFETWIDAIKEVANYYSFPVLDFYNLSNINPHLNQTLQGTAVGYEGFYNPYVPDGTHPTQEGQDIMGDVMTGFLKSIVG